MPDDIIRNRILRTGDGSHKISKEIDINNNKNEDSRDIEHFWGFGDKEMNADDMKNVKILHKSVDWFMRFDVYTLFLNKIWTKK